MEIIVAFHGWWPVLWTSVFCARMECIGHPVNYQGVTIKIAESSCYFGHLCYSIVERHSREDVSENKC